MKKLICLVMVLGMVAAMLLGCASQPAPAAEPAAAPAEEAAAPAEGAAAPADEELVYTGPEMELSVNFATVEQNVPYFLAAFDRITERTGGKVTFAVTFSNGLLSLFESLNGLSTGVADISDVTLSNFAAQFVNTTQVCATPFLGYNDILVANDIVYDVVMNNEMMMKEFEAQNIRPIITSAIYGTALICRDDIAITTPDTLKNVKVLTSDPVFSEFITANGGAPVVQPVTEMYSALSNGVVDCVANGVNVAKAFGAVDVAKVIYRFDEDLSTHIKTTSINLDVWNSFDDTLKQIFAEETGEKMYQDFRTFVENQEAAQESWLKEIGMKVVYIGGEDLAAWKAGITPFGEANLQKLFDEGNAEVFDALEIWKAAIAKHQG